MVDQLVYQLDGSNPIPDCPKLLQGMQRLPDQLRREDERTVGKPEVAARRVHLKRLPSKIFF